MFTEMMMSAGGGGINTNVILDGTTAPTTLNVESGKHYVCCLQGYDYDQPLDHFSFSNTEELSYLLASSISSYATIIHCVVFKATSNTVEITNGSPNKIMLIQLD